MNVNTEDFCRNLLCNSSGPRDRVWVRNRVESPPVYPKFDRLWQGPEEVLQCSSESTH